MIFHSPSPILARVFVEVLESVVHNNIVIWLHLYYINSFVYQYFSFTFMRNCRRPIS